MTRKRFQELGFTLIEIIVVIAIIAVLSVIVSGNLMQYMAKARDAKRISDFRQIQIALGAFYEQTGKYPKSPGHATWSGHWANFSQCLETGVNCGFTISNYVPVISKVPQDPLRKTTDPYANDYTYWPGYPTGCSDGQKYRLAASLETDNAVLQGDLDGSFYSNNNGCEDTSSGYYKRMYCVGMGSCTGW